MTDNRQTKADGGSGTFAGAGQNLTPEQQAAWSADREAARDPKTGHNSDPRNR